MLLPAGAGQDVGRSCCIVRMAGRTVMFDCGAHFGFRCGAHSAGVAFQEA